jgi:catechol 2,3-dioxygenase-like lactoylglutathione lyase family enzyme
MDHLSGVGGAFLFSRDPDRLAAWYTEHLGCQFERAGFGAYYQIYWTLDPEDTSCKLDTTFSIMRAKTDFPRWDGEVEPEEMYGDQPFMVNLRVRDMDALLAHLAGKGIEPIKREDESYGRFAWVRDLDGNRIELYQPVPQSE